jgi:mRNA interferase RelE/StbE
MYSIEFAKNSERDFDKLPKDMQIRLLNVLERIKINPFHFIKRKEGTDNFILRVGDYRAILEIDLSKSVIYVVKIEHRKKIYKS